MKRITLKAGIIKRVHVNRFNIAKNAKDGGRRPQWIVQTSRGPVSCHKVSGSRLVGSGPDDPQLSCGARVYLTTRAALDVFVDPREDHTKLTKELLDE